jgi:uncharacterized protein YejL (UPF0352 family)
MKSEVLTVMGVFETLAKKDKALARSVLKEMLAVLEKHLTS